ncbi:CRISPR-associated endonuclease Cas2 [Berryella wangjianweii]|nr:CRISPR-associated endonuclease Cas2 [Berryella wangjianweii]
MAESERVRFMRLIVFFDLPVNDYRRQRAYRAFRKFLIHEGYLMMQESVYSKLVLNEGASAAAIARLRKNAPSQGLVQVLKVTERQFSSMVYVTGRKAECEEVDTMESLLVI